MNNNADKPNADNPERRSANWKLHHAPVAEVPSLQSLVDDLQTRQTQRNVRRKRLAGAVSGSLVGLMVVLSLQTSLDEPTAPNDGTAGLETSRSATASQPRGKENAPPVIQPQRPQLADTKPKPSIRLYANVRSTAPIFISDERTGALVPIGWLRQNGQIPVDLDSFSDEQVDGFHAVLNEVPQNVSL